MKLLAVEGERAGSFSQRRAENEGGAEALPPPRFKTQFRFVPDLYAPGVT